MDKFLKKQLYAWVYEKIKSNPQKFGGKKSNPFITAEYLKEFYGGCYVYQLEPKVMSVISTVSRAKNKILKANPHFDYRVKKRLMLKR